MYLSSGQHLAGSWRYVVETRRESSVRLVEEVCRLDVVESGGLSGGPHLGGVSGVQVDGVSGEMMSSAGMIKVTVGADDYARPVILVN